MKANIGTLVEHFKEMVAKHMGHYDIVIIGSGPAGLSLAITAYDMGERSILIIDRESELGGELKQCIQDDGFGKEVFKENLTGEEFAERYIKGIKERGIDYRLDTTVLKITKDKHLFAVSPEGVMDIEAKSIVLAMGCRENPRGTLDIPGARPAGIFCAGTLQKLMKSEGSLPGKDIVILGSDDIGLTMASRLKQEGANVVLVCETKPYLVGMPENKKTSLDKNNIPLLLSHEITEIKGKHRVEGVVIGEVNDYGELIEGSEKEYACDTVLLSTGFIPENELSREVGVELSPLTLGPIVDDNYETNLDGIFACGNVLHISPRVDYITKEAEIAGKKVVEYLRRLEKGKVIEKKNIINITPGRGVSYVVPQKICLQNADEDVIVKFRSNSIFENLEITVYLDDSKYQTIYRRKFLPSMLDYVHVRRSDLKNVKDIRIEIY